MTTDEPDLPADHGVTITRVEHDELDDLYQIAGPMLQQPQLVRGEDVALGRAARLIDKSLPPPPRGEAVIKATLHIN